MCRLQSLPHVDVLASQAIRPTEPFNLLMKWSFEQKS